MKIILSSFLVLISSTAFAGLVDFRPSGQAFSELVLKQADCLIGAEDSQESTGLLQKLFTDIYGERADWKWERKVTASVFTRSEDANAPYPLYSDIYGSFGKAGIDYPNMEVLEMGIRLYLDGSIAVWPDNKTTELTLEKALPTVVLTEAEPNSWFDVFGDLNFGYAKALKVEFQNLDNANADGSVWVNQKTKRTTKFISNLSEYTRCLESALGL